LGLFEKRGGGSAGLSDDLIGLIAGVRERLRVEKNYAMADEIRDLLGEEGVTLADTKDGTSWKIDRD
jgi:cysteinyl-tRNA synthetase